MWRRRSRGGCSAENAVRRAVHALCLVVDLTGEERGAPAGPILDHLQQVAPFAVTNRREYPVVKDQQIGFAQLREQFAVRAIASSDHEVRQEPW